MRNCGILRKVDNLGRIVIPMGLRRTLNLAEKDCLEIFTDGGQIVLRKYEPGCLLCGELKGVVNYKGKNICKKCFEEMKRR